MPTTNSRKDLRTKDMKKNKVATIPSSVTNTADPLREMLKDRLGKYGLFENQAGIVQNLKYVMKATPRWEGLDPDQKECLEMVQHKIGRILNGDPDLIDSWEDIVGYTQLVVDRLRRTKPA